MHTPDGKRLVVRADEKLTGFLELESVIKGRDGGSVTRDSVARPPPERGQTAR
jgi:hypothetical protein